MSKNEITAFFFFLIKSDFQTALSSWIKSCDCDFSSEISQPNA